MTTTALAPSSSSFASRYAILAYGAACYVLGVGGLGMLILASLGILPLTGGPVETTTMFGALAVNAALVAAFAIQHTIMARPAFKRAWGRVLPASAERSTFVLLAGVLMACIVWMWQPLPGAAWAVETAWLRWTLLGACAIGWSYMLLASFAIDHFELFGLRQTWRASRGDTTPPPAFKERLQYSFDRHPIMTGILIALWATPDMSYGRLALAGLLTLYIVFGVAVEERTLVTLHGERYRDYARRVGTIVPSFLRRRA